MNSKPVVYSDSAEEKDCACDAPKMLTIKPYQGVEYRSEV